MRIRKGLKGEPERPIRRKGGVGSLETMEGRG
jgi:hypothetical protein